MFSHLVLVLRCSLFSVLGYGVRLTYFCCDADTQEADL